MIAFITPLRFPPPLLGQIKPHQLRRLRSERKRTTSYLYGSAVNTTGQPGAVGQLVAITYPSGRIVLYAYDALGRINQVSTQATRTAALQMLASNIQ